MSFFVPPVSLFDFYVLPSSPKLRSQVAVGRPRPLLVSFLLYLLNRIPGEGRERQGERGREREREGQRERGRLIRRTRTRSLPPVEPCIPSAAPFGSLSVCPVRHVEAPSSFVRLRPPAAAQPRFLPLLRPWCPQRPPPTTPTSPLLGLLLSFAAAAAGRAAELPESAPAR